MTLCLLAYTVYLLLYKTVCAYIPYKKRVKESTLKPNMHLYVKFCVQDNENGPESLSASSYRSVGTESPL